MIHSRCSHYTGHRTANIVAAAAAELSWAVASRQPLASAAILGEGQWRRHRAIYRGEREGESDANELSRILAKLYTINARNESLRLWYHFTASFVMLSSVIAYIKTFLNEMFPCVQSHKTRPPHAGWPRPGTQGTRCLSFPHIPLIPFVTRHSQSGNRFIK